MVVVIVVLVIVANTYSTSVGSNSSHKLSFSFHMKDHSDFDVIICPIII